MKHQVIRIEDKHGKGMYHSLWSIAVTKIFGDSSYDPVTHADPYEDKLLEEQWYKLVENADYYYGFIDEAQFKKWVKDPQWRKTLNFYGGVMKFYEVEDKDVLVGETQVMFLKDNAKLVKEEKVTFFD
jgi:hypothetical protein